MQFASAFKPKDIKPYGRVFLVATANSLTLGRPRQAFRPPLFAFRHFVIFVYWSVQVRKNSKMPKRKISFGDPFPLSWGAQGNRFGGGDLLHVCANKVRTVKEVPKKNGIFRPRN